MSEVKRYEFEVYQMSAHPQGDYVHYEDYAELKAQRDALAAEVSAIREQAENVYSAGYNHGHVNTVDGIAYATPVEDEFYHNALQIMLEVETPATDAYLNSVRAEAVTSFAHHQRVIADSETDPTIQRGHRITARRAEDFAAQLREGEPS